MSFMRRYILIFTVLTVAFAAIRAPERLFAFGTAVLFHEAAHFTAARLFGAFPSLPRVRAGGLEIAVSGTLTPLAGILVALSGPAANFALAAVISLLPEINGALSLTAVSSLLLGTLNLLPLRGFDGETAAVSALSLLHIPAAEKIVSAVGNALLCALWLVSICVLLAASGSFSLFAFCACVFIINLS